jgi:D-glycero-alpha-D-manno-heptose-7-phosphate kinase
MITSEWHNLSEWLGEHTVTSSAPCRVDCGSGSDQRLWALLCRRWHPATTNIALELRTTVQLKSHTPGKILVEVQGLGEEEVSILKVPLTSDFGLIFAIVSHFGVHGVHLVINSKSPLRSGLGGSGAVSVATIGALSKAVSRLGVTAQL